MFARLLELDCWPRRFDGSLAAAAAVKNLTSELIGRFCRAAEQATRPAGHPPLTRYAADLAVPRQQRLECALLKGVTAHYVMSRSGVVPRRPASARSSPSWPRRVRPARRGRWSRCSGRGSRRPPTTRPGCGS